MKLDTFKPDETLFSDRVHSIVPQFVKKRNSKIDWEELKRAILKIVLPGCAPITAEEIYDRVKSLISFDLKADNTSQPIRKACKLLLEEDYEPIVSCTKGFFYGESKQDIIQMMDMNSNRIKGLERSQASLSAVLRRMP